MQNHLRHRMKIGVIFILMWLIACTRPAPEAPTWQPSSPFVTFGPPTPISLASLIPPTRAPGTPIVSPTPDIPHILPTPRHEEEQYIAQDGDTLGQIALDYGVSLKALMEANQLTDADALSAGQVLIIPVPTPGPVGPGFKIIPNSELVFGPASITLDLRTFIEQKNGYLASYQQEVDGEYLNAEQIITRVVQNYSVNPRFLLALIEHRSQWVSNPNPDPTTLDYPLGFFDPPHAGLYRQLTWASNELNRGYYLWQVNALPTLALIDGSIVPVNASINAGTAGVENLFAQLDERAEWETDVTVSGLFQTYVSLFGYPFDLAIDPLIAPDLTQPPMQLPFESNDVWSFTGGPHAAWDSGSGWGALDFAPPGEAQGCVLSNAWIAAVANGLIVRAANNAVMQDLDGDGFEQTGWVVLYMHVEDRDRVQPGTYLQAGKRIGHPSCEGGISNGTHVHIARRFNGEWIPADGNLPFILDGWVSSGTGVEYDGYLTRGDQTIEAWDGKNDLNQIQR